MADRPSTVRERLRAGWIRTGVRTVRTHLNGRTVLAVADDAFARYTREQISWAWGGMAVHTVSEITREARHG